MNEISELIRAIESIAESRNEQTRELARQILAEFGEYVLTSEKVKDLVFLHNKFVEYINLN